MDYQVATDLARDAVRITLMMGAPVLLAGMAVGLLVGLLQAVTQVQEQTVAFVPKIVAMIVVFSFTLPWLMSNMLEYSTDLIGGIPDRLTPEHAAELRIDDEP